MLSEWTAYVEGMLPTGGKHAAGRLSDEEFQTAMGGLKRDHEAGNKGAVPSIIALCFADARPVPGWVQDEFWNACSDISWHRFKSWDDVFGRPLKKGAQLAAARRHRRLVIPVAHRVEQRVAGGEPIDKNMFDAIAEELRVDPAVRHSLREKLKIGGTLVGQVYDECKKVFGEEWKKRWTADWPRKNRNFRKL